MNTADLLRQLKIDQLNPMQIATAKAYREDNDLVLLSPTGTGKTLAYLLPLAQALTDGQEGVQALIVVPSRELALQTEAVFKAMGTGFKAMSCYGGRPAMDEHRTMKELHPAVIVGTPGRLNDHLDKQNFDASTVATLVIDEFDKSLELGFHDEMAALVGRLPRLRKRVLLSATDAEEIPRFTGLGKVTRLDFLTPDKPTDRLRLYRVLSPQKDKLETLYRLLYAGVRQLPRERRPRAGLPAQPEVSCRSLPRRHGAARPRTLALQVQKRQLPRAGVYRPGCPRA